MQNCSSVGPKKECGAKWAAAGDQVTLLWCNWQLALGSVMRMVTTKSLYCGVIGTWPRDEDGDQGGQGSQYKVITTGE